MPAPTISFVAQRSHNRGSIASSSFTLVPDTDCLAGNLLIVNVHVAGASAINFVSISDSSGSGNVWNMDTSNNGSGFSVNSMIASCVLTGSILSPSQHITITTDITMSSYVIWLEEFAYISTRDNVATPKNWSSTLTASTNAVTTSQINELAVSSFLWTVSPAVTPGASSQGFSTFPTAYDTGGPSTSQCSMGYKICPTASVSTFNSVTLGGSNNTTGVGLLAVYRGLVTPNANVGTFDPEIEPTEWQQTEQRLLAWYDKEMADLATTVATSFVFDTRRVVRNSLLRR